MLVTKTTAASLPFSAQSTPSFLVLAAGILIALPEYVHYAFRHTTGWLIRSEINKLGVAHMNVQNGHRLVTGIVTPGVSEEHGLTTVHAIISAPVSRNACLFTCLRQTTERPFSAKLSLSISAATSKKSTA